MKCTVVNLKKAHYDVHIGRGSKWGNPFPMKNNTQAERDRVCEEYEKYFYTTDLLTHLHELRGKTLGCYCKPLRCHGDFLAKLVNERYGDLCKTCKTICDECIYKDEESSLCASYEGGVCLSYCVKNWFGKIKTKVNTIFDVDKD